MGLLRKAAHAAARDENQVPTAGTATATEDERADLPAASGTGARTGLLRKITERMETAQLAAAVELARAVEPPAAPSLFEPAVEASPTPEEAVLEEEPSTEPLPFQTVTEAPTATEAPAAEPIAPAEAIVDPQKLTLDILGSLKSLPDGVELPSQLFSLLIARLGIQKGALLLFDPLRMVYAPWASRGYDPTTTHRMRISLGASESWNALANGSPMLLTDPPALAAYQPYFSSRGILLRFPSASRSLYCGGEADRGSPCDGSRIPIFRRPGASPVSVAGFTGGVQSGLRRARITTDRRRYRRGQARRFTGR